MGTEHIMPFNLHMCTCVNMSGAKATVIMIPVHRPRQVRERFLDFVCKSCNTFVSYK